MRFSWAINLPIWVYQFLRFVLAFDEHKIKIKIVSWLYTSKRNMYMVLRRNSFCYCGSPTFTVPLNSNFTLPFEENPCQRNSFYYCGSPTLAVPLNPNFIFPFEGNFCQRNSLCFFCFPTFPVPLNPNFTFPLEGNSCQRNRDSCKLPQFL